MLRWVRDRVRPVAAVVLVTLVALGGLSSVAHGSDCHDEECGIALFPHDPASHSIRNGSADASHPVHCVLCHWTRSVRPSTESVPHLTTPLADDVRLHAELPGVLSPVQAAQPPLRSPPIAPALNG